MAIPCLIPCLSTSIILWPCVSNTFGLWFLCLCTRTSQHPFASNTFDYGCLFVGLSQNGYGMGQTETPLREGVGFRLSPDLPSHPHHNEGDT